MTYVLRQDQVKRLRNSGKIMSQIRAAVECWKVAGMNEKEKNVNSCHLVKMSVEHRIDGVGSCDLRAALDCYFAALDHSPKRDIDAEIKALDRQISGLWKVAIGDAQKALISVAGKGR